MHPKEIIQTVEGKGSEFFIVDGKLFILSPHRLGNEYLKLIEGYKARVIAYLQNDYSEEEHRIFITVDRIINYMCGEEQPSNEKIATWLVADKRASDTVLLLLNKLSENGYFAGGEPIANYETYDTFKLSTELYERSMHYFKNGEVMK